MSHVERVESFFHDPKPYLSRSYNIRLRCETVKELVGDREVSNILDVGCGDGSLSLPLLNGRNRLTLVDITPGMLEIARSRVPEAQQTQVKTQLGDLMQVDLPTGEFDLVLCMGVFAHVDSPDAVIDRVSQLLAPGGKTIVTVSSGKHLIGFLRSLYAKLRDAVSPPPYKLKWISSRKVIERFEKNGLILDKVFRYNFPAPGMDRMLSNERLYNNIRRRYGSPSKNTRAWMGSEFIISLRKPQ